MEPLHIRDGLRDNIGCLPYTFARSGGMPTRHKKSNTCSPWSVSAVVMGALTVFRAVVLFLCRRKRRRRPLLLNGVGARATGRGAVRLHERRPKTVLFRVQDALRDGRGGGRQNGRRQDTVGILEGKQPVITRHATPM